MTSSFRLRALAKFSLTTTPVLIFFLMVACTKSQGELSLLANKHAKSNSVPSEDSARDGSGKIGGGAGETAVIPGSGTTQFENRVMVYTSQLTVYIKSLTETEKRLPALLATYEAYISNSETGRYNELERRAEWTIRVPVGKYAALLKELGGLGGLVSSSSKVDDMTAEYVDIEARLKNKRDVESRLQSILAQKAAKLSDILEVEKELGRVREDIDATLSRLNYLKSQASMSTITLEAYESSKYFSNLNDASFLEKVQYQFLDSITALKNFCLRSFYFFIYIIPWISIGVLGFWLFRKFKTWRTKRREARTDA
jgi:hypothetical protein